MIDRLTSAQCTLPGAASLHAGAERQRRSAPAAIVALAVTVALTALSAPPAGAAPRPAPAARTTEAAAPRAAGEPIMAVVSIKSQQVTFYDADGWILRAPVSTGTTGRETPAGVFAVVEKDKDHHSTLYDDAWMPNMLRITWSGIALHGGPLPGYAASHGCIRMPYDFAEKVFDEAWIGMRVIISPQDAAPVEFSDPSLFVPQQKVIDALPAQAETLASAAEEATEAATAAKTALATAKRAAAAGPATVRNLEFLKRRADAELAYAEKLRAAAKMSEAKADDMTQKAAAKIEELRTQLAAAKADQQPKLAAIAAAQALAKTTEAKRVEAAQAAKEAKLALEPVSVFISRATQKIYVRRDTHKQERDGGDRFDTIELPVKIQNPDRPIGTHIFTAVAPTAGGLRWTAVTIDNGDSAKDALDRITFPKEVLDRIAPTTLPRSSIIISDEPPNRETNYRTEFVVVLNNQPQGGLAMRRPPADEEVAHGNTWGNSFGYFSRWGDWGSQNGFTRQGGSQSYYPGRRGFW
jgi:L,D-transpeptidase-like protein